MTTLRWTRHPDFPGAKAPVRAHPTDAGLDVFAAEAVVVRPGEVVKCRTGVCIHPEPTIPDADSYGFNRPGGWTYAALVWDKSGLASRGLTTLGGVIDDPYTGEVLIVVSNVWLAPLLKVLTEANDRAIRALATVLHDTDETLRGRIESGDRPIEALVAALHGAESSLPGRLGAADVMKADALNRLFNVEIKAGEKLAQLVVQRVELPVVEGDPRELVLTGRGSNGFASTGL